VGAARCGDIAAARQDVEKLAAIQSTLVQTKDVYWADQVEVQSRAAWAWLALAQGDREKALERMRAAAELEDWKTRPKNIQSRRARSSLRGSRWESCSSN
jgi:hypothetical protein